MKIQNHSILCVGFPPWEGDYMKSTILLMKELAKYNHVLYVEYPFTWTDVITGLIGIKKRPVKRIIGTDKRLVTIPLDRNRQMHVLTLPPLIPLKWVNDEGLYEWISVRNAKKVRNAIQKALDELNFTSTIHINAFNPFLGKFLLGEFDAKLQVYYCYDQISAANWAGKHGPRLEADFIPKVDGIITSSAALFKEKSIHAKEAFLVKNGVDFDLFHQAVNIKTQHLHAETPSLTVGYVGSLDNRLDYDLLEQLIQQMPDIRFLFVGRVIETVKVKKLQSYPNFECTGPQTPRELPIFLAQMKVGMIPFVKNEFTKHIYPLKINEYLAAGLSVVSTSFSDLSDFDTIIHIAPTSSQFIESVGKLVKEGDGGIEQDRIRMAKLNSWESRANEFSDALWNMLYE